MINITDSRVSASTRRLLQALAQDSGEESRTASDARPAVAKSLRLSFIVSIVDERRAIAELYTRIALTCCLRSMNYEIIFIDRGSKDGTWEEISELSSGKNHICGIRVKPGSSDEEVLEAGLQVSSGDLVFTLRAGSDSAVAIGHFIAKMNEGYDVAYGVTDADTKGNDIRPQTHPAQQANRVPAAAASSQTIGYACYSARMIRRMARKRLPGANGLDIPVHSALRGCRSCEIVVQPL